MAGELNHGDVTGLTVTAVPYLAGVAQTPISCPEIGSSGMYQGSMTGAAGIYQLAFLSGGTTLIGTGQIEWDGTAEVTQTTIRARLPSALVGGKMDSSVGTVDANITKVAGTTIPGSGTVGSPWGPL